MNSGFPAGRVNLDALRRGPVEWSGELPAEAAVWDLGDLDFADGPRLEYRAESGARRGIRVVGRLELTLRVECTRCLAEIRCPVGIEFDYRFDPSVEEWEELLFDVDSVKEAYVCANVKVGSVAVVDWNVFFMVGKQEFGFSDVPSDEFFGVCSVFVCD
jgi:hypothetical protein